VASSLRVLGIPCKRIKDSPIRVRNPNPKYRWLSAWSPHVKWMYESCLGLRSNERTSNNAVRMDWMMTSPSKFRLWFLRGLADSDGSVNFRNNNVTIITSQNTKLVRELPESLGLNVGVGISKGCGVVTIATSDAEDLGVFNPEVITHRRKALTKLVAAKKFQRRWPDDLKRKVKRLICEGENPVKIAHKIFEEDNTYVKTKTIWNYVKKLEPRP